MPNIEQLKKAYDTFDRKLFVSCWFNFVDLADVVFKVCAKNNTGITIGTSVDRLTGQLSQATANYNNDSRNQDNKIANVVCANIQYVPQNLMGRKDLFEPAQVYSPIFTKSSQFHMDHEFCVCLEMEKAETLSYNSEQNQRVQYIAVKDDGLFHKRGKNQFFLFPLNAEVLTWSR